MSHVIRIADTTLEKMQSVAIPLQDDHNSVLDRVLNFYLQHNGKSGRGENQSSAEQVLSQNPDSPDDLSWSKIRWGRFGNRKLSSRNWSELAKVAHEVASEKYNSFDQIRKMTPFNVVDGKLEERGYHFIPNADLSIQYRSGPDNWEYCLEMARSLGLTIEVEIEWPNKEGVAHPGERGKLAWSPGDSG
jgi:hypothetical protein